MSDLTSKIKAVIIGHAVGDALGVPVEFHSREELKKHPVTDMRGYGTYPVPAGAWSDDTSMSLAALDSLSDGKVDFDEIMTNFVKWFSLDEYTYRYGRAHASLLPPPRRLGASDSDTSARPEAN